MAEREQLEVDVLIVGAGPAGLAAAYRIAERAKAHDASVAAGKLKGAKLGELNIAVIEKTRDVGDAILSGAIMDPKGIRELIPDWRSKGAPVEAVVTDPGAYWFTQARALRFPITPPPLNDRGGVSISLSKFTRWMKGLVEAQGVNVLTEVAGREVLYDGSRVLGIRTGDKGIDKRGERRANFEPGMDIVAKVTIFAEGVRGSLTRDHIARLDLANGCNPPSFATGVKEVWRIRPGALSPGAAYYTMGFPQERGAIGGGWIYSMAADHVSIGYVTWLAYEDPFTNPHQRFQMWKTHPFVRALLDGATLVQYGAKAVNVGGLFSVPKIHGDGFLLAGESANLVDGMKLKGVHMAIGSGRRAGDAAVDALLVGDASEAQLVSYREAIDESWIHDELRQSRNFHQAFDHGFWLGMARAGVQTVLGGMDPFGSRLSAHSDASHVQTISEFHGTPEAKPPATKFDGVLTSDKLAGVFLAGSMHAEDQPSHLVVADTKICVERCTYEFGNPCVKFCPAAVYEMEGAGPGRHHKINASNCVHCKTCDIMDPYDNIRWQVPEGGGGPRYQVM